ncbi:MAG: NAD(P)-dependent oxidoreductase [Sphingomonadales bacterium]|nr:MAG: NAD(P)-dependent oxidoreductase [Sphingomonadales bacterium]
MRVGFIGLGDQGGPMARMIVEGGFGLGIWARRDAVKGRFAGWGATVASDPAALAAESDLMCLCVTGDADVREILIERGVIAAMRKRTFLAIHSTIMPDTCVEMARLAAARGVTLLDLPVSGSGHAALDRKLLVMAGGDPKAVARIMPVLETYAGTIIRMGEVGAAMNAKLINNLMAVVNIGQAYRALSLGKAMGVDPAALREALMVGTGRSFAIDLIKRLHVPERADHVRGVLRKDVDLAIGAMPPGERSYWAPLAENGLTALDILVSGAVTLLSEMEEEHGEYIVDGTA